MTSGISITRWRDKAIKPDDYDDVAGLVATARKARGWTYHVNMRLPGRYISREQILGAVDSYAIVEAYPEDKYLPSYLLLATSSAASFHALFAADVDDDNVRVITAYHPNADEWESDFKTRKGRLS